MAKTNKYALVTGGSRGIGREICLKLGGCGYHVLVNYKSNAAEAEKTLSGIRAAGGDGEALQFDVASGEESTAAIEAWQKAHEGACIEVVVNNAGHPRRRADDVDGTAAVALGDRHQPRRVLQRHAGRCSRGCS